MIQLKGSRYHLIVKNQPGELAKLTRLLADAGVSVTSLTVASVGDKSAIQFTAPRYSEPRLRACLTAWSRTSRRPSGCSAR